MIQLIERVLKTKISQQTDAYVAHHQDIHLHSYFQPIYSLAQQRMVGYEGLMRAQQQGCFIPPVDVFKACQTEEQIIQLDRITRSLHLLNFKVEQQRDNWIFLNIRAEEINPSNLSPSRLIKLLKYLGYQPQQVVLEILEDPLLIEFIASYRQAGILIAIDDFGAGHSNFDRIWKINPNIVKLDRSMIQSAIKEKRARRIFSRLVSLIRETESLVLIEGVETQDEALLCMDTEADMVQGYYFSRPSANLQHQQTQETFSQLNQHHKTSTAQLSFEYQRRIEAIENLVNSSANLIHLGTAFTDSCNELLNHPSCNRVYMLNQNGYQVTQTIESNPSELHYKPFEQGQGANWGKREYFTNAISALGKVYISKPYLSLPDGMMNTTFSLAFYLQNDMFVLCCDIDLSYLEADKVHQAKKSASDDLTIGIPTQ